MTPTLLPYFAILSVVITSVVVAAGRNSPKDDVIRGLPDGVGRRYLLPLFVSQAALRAALKAGEELEDPSMFANGGNSMYSGGVDSSAASPAMFKRKMFWQPLGYMSASARRQNLSKGNNQMGANSDSGSSLFRYG